MALSEPIRRKEYGGLDTLRGAVARIDDFAEETRARLLAEGRASSVQFGGRLDDNRDAAGRNDSGLRQLRARWDEIEIGKPLTPRFTLVVKHNALFTALLPLLSDSFPCLALVRNPLAVLASWQTVDLPVQRGRVPAGEELDGELRSALDAEASVLGRQLTVLDWFFARFSAHLPAENIIRYEDLVASGGLPLFRRLGHAGTPPVALESGNSSAFYNRATIDSLLRALLDRGGAWRRFYRPSDCERVAARILQR